MEEREASGEWAAPEVELNYFICNELRLVCGRKASDLLTRVDLLVLMREW